MFSWLLTLPWGWQVGLAIIAMFLITIIAIYGKLWFSVGKNKIGIGGKKQKRSCMDCSKLHRAESTKVNRKIAKIETSATKGKMTYAEQKLLDLKRTLYKAFSTKLKGDGQDYKELRDLNARLKLTLKVSVQNEIRRSFKENGFHERDGGTFTEYVEDQTGTILDILEEDMMLYYDNTLISNIIDETKTEISDTLYSVYNNAKIVEVDSITKIHKLESDYDDSIDEFIGITKSEVNNAKF